MSILKIELNYWKRKYKTFAWTAIQIIQKTKLLEVVALTNFVKKYWKKKRGSHCKPDDVLRIIPHGKKKC